MTKRQGIIRKLLFNCSQANPALLRAREAIQAPFGARFVAFAICPHSQKKPAAITPTVSIVAQHWQATVGVENFQPIPFQSYRPTSVFSWHVRGISITRAQERHRFFMVGQIVEMLGISRGRAEDFQPLRINPQHSIAYQTLAYRRRPKSQPYSLLPNIGITPETVAISKPVCPPCPCNGDGGRGFGFGLLCALANDTGRKRVPRYKNAMMRKKPNRTGRKL